MADHDRTAPPPVTPAVEARDLARDRSGAELLRALEQTPYAFDFFQALRRLECLFRDRPRFGSAARPGEEPIRLGQEITMTVAPATLARFTPATHDAPARLNTYFFGVFGPDGALPLHLTDYAKQRAYHSGDPTLVRFLDMFHHRLLSLFYRAWASGQPTVQRDRPDSDRFLMYLGALCGLGLPTLQKRDLFPDHAKLYYAGLLAPQSRNAAGLRAMIQDFMQMPTRIEECVGEWVTIPRAHGWHLGIRSRRGGPMLGKLSQSAIVGTRVWMRQHRFRVVLGPLRREQFRAMLPGSLGLPRLAALVSNYIGQEFKWDVRLVLRPDATRPMELGASAQLGRTSWIVAKVGAGDWEDLVLDPAQDYAHTVGTTRKRPSNGPMMQGAEHV